ncbi:MAG: F0F1 ATP synthase subunit B family protein [Rhizomicrobium sp.]
MIDADTMNAAVGQPAPHEASGGFPPFDASTFPSQIFWLVVTFAFLFVVMWRVAGPRINGVITMRRNKINGDIAAAQKSRGDAEAASAAYQTALAGARAKANAHAEETRKRIGGEIDKAKADAEAQAHEATTKAEARIQAMRADARVSMAKAAQDAAIDIVSRLTGETVSAADAAAAVKAASGN